MRPGLFAFAAACACFGAALYINVVEQPARLTLDNSAMMREWTPSNRRGFVLVSALAIISALLAYVEFVRTFVGIGRSGDVRWLIGGSIVLAIWPFVYFVVVPVNFWLYALPPEAGNSPVRELMRDWGLLEWGQTVIALAGCWILAWPIAMPA
jgi:hypothetical protein